MDKKKQASSLSKKETDRLNILNVNANQNAVSYNGQSFEVTKNGDEDVYVLNGKIVDKNDFDNAVQTAEQQIEHDMLNYSTAHPNTYSTDEAYIALSEKQAAFVALIGS